VRVWADLGTFEEFLRFVVLRARLIISEVEVANV